MEFSDESLQELNKCLDNEKANEICIKLEIFNKKDSRETKMEKLKEYITEDLYGKFRGELSINAFFKKINSYLRNNDLIRINEEGSIPYGFIDYNFVLPIKNNSNQSARGLSTLDVVLGADGNKYIVKKSEIRNGRVACKKNAKDAIYNPTIAYAFFKYLGEECAEYIPGFEKYPNYYCIFSKSFLKENQELSTLDDGRFLTNILVVDENNNITHKSILDSIESSIKEKGFGEALSNKLKLQYAVQETIKKLICSMDENLGNTSFITTKNNKGEITDINISPAYDLDLSFALGEEIKEMTSEEEIFSRVGLDGKKDLKSMMKEFNVIPGYKEKMQDFLQKFDGGYIDRIFEIAYETSRIEEFKEKFLKEKYGHFIAKRVALFKELSKEENENEIRKE